MEPVPATAIDQDAARAERLRRFRGPVEERDAEIVDYWRDAPPEAHARAMIELAHYAEQMVAHTGFDKDRSEMFPGFPQPESPHGDAAA